MLVAITNLKLSAVECTKEFMNFSHFFGLYKRAEKNLEDYKAGKLSFRFAEMGNAGKELQDAYEKSVTAAINKLFVLDRAFKKIEGVHIVAQLDDFETFVKALEEIENFLAR